jgi:hypothetical protein
MVNESPRRSPRTVRRLLLSALALSSAAVLCTAPGPAAAEFRCAASVDYHANRCASSQITSIGKVAGAAICTDYTRRLGEVCRPDWDRFKSCQDFARRFENLLVDACKARQLPSKSCRDWGDAYASGERTRCERGRSSY